MTIGVVVDNAGKRHRRCSALLGVVRTYDAAANGVVEAVNVFDITLP